MADDTGGRPCTQCGAQVADGRSVCPACGTFQPASPTAGAAPGPAAPLPPIAPSSADLRMALTSSPAAPGPTRRGGSAAPFVIALVLVFAAIAGGAYVVSQREDPPSSSAAEEEPERKSDLETAWEQADAIAGDMGLTTTTGTPTPTGSTAVPTASLTWTPVHDDASGLSWKMPGAMVGTVPDMVTEMVTNGGPTGPRAGWITDDQGIIADITVWEPSNQANQAHIDAILDWDEQYQKRINEPYGKQLTLAGQPAVAVLSRPKPDSTYVAMAVVDGALVRVQISAAGRAVDPAVFEQLLTSFTKG